MRAGWTRTAYCSRAATLPVWRRAAGAAAAGKPARTHADEQLFSMPVLPAGSKHLSRWLIYVIAQTAYPTPAAAATRLHRFSTRYLCRCSRLTLATRVLAERTGGYCGSAARDELHLVLMPVRRDGGISSLLVA